MNIIDIHIHGIGGYDTRTANEQDILKIAWIQASCGVSEIIPTIYADTVEVMQENMLAVKKAMEIQKQEVRSKKQAAGKYANIRGVNLEGPFLNPERCGALIASSFIEPTEYNLKKLLDGFEDIVKIITIAPELDGALKLIKQIAAMGIIVSMGHSDATYAEAEAGFNAGAKGITHIFNAMRSYHHREPGITGFGLLNSDIYVEVIADPYHLHPKTIELIFRMKNPEKIILVSDTVKSSAGSEKGMERGITDNSGRLLGGAMTVADASGRLIELGYDTEVIKRIITENPERYLSGGISFNLR